MTFPKIALIGRPNVGKSALFNRLLKKRIAIVDEMEGVTRDRIYGEGEFELQPYILIDTAGIETTDHSELNVDILNQSKLAIDEADFCVFVVDAQIGITRMDQEIAKILRQKKKPVCLAVNKIDIDQHAELTYEFYPLGFDRILGISAEHGRNIYELLETIFENMPEITQEDLGAKEAETISIVGRTNVGKSTLMNYLSKQPRCVVSPIAGTTRDAIEVEIEYGDKSYSFIDTAGIRRKNKEKIVVEKFAHIRTFGAIEKSEICLFLIDAQEGLTAQEKKFLSEIYKNGKSCIVVVNKWDLAEGFRMEHAHQALIKDSPFLSIYPVVFISALTGRNVEKLFPLIEQVTESRNRSVETSTLNKFILEAIQKSPPPMISGKRLRVYYMTQIRSGPPSFLFFVNVSTLLTPTYKRYLMNRMREAFDFTATPVQFYLRSKNKASKDKSVKEPLSYFA
ncbi:MAG: GTPase Der [Chlamydiae bacterium]|nr:GTPase Der [Chlamydiota bacterium]